MSDPISWDYFRSAVLGWLSEDVISLNPSDPTRTRIPEGPNYVAFQLEMNPLLTWWKGVVVLAADGIVLGTSETQDAQKVGATVLLERSHVRGAHIELQKAKTFGVHTGMYRLNLDQMPEEWWGTQVRFNWWAARSEWEGGSADLDTGKTYRLRAVHSGKVLDVSGVSREQGAPVIQWDWWGGDNQKWRIARQPDGSYSITSVHSGMVLDVSANSRDNGAPVQQWPWLGGNNQKWRIEWNTDHTCRLVSVNSGLVLDVRAISADNGAQVQQWPWLGGANQRWIFDAL